MPQYVEGVLTKVTISDQWSPNHVEPEPEITNIEVTSRDFNAIYLDEQITLTFSSPIKQGTGNITFHDVSKGEDTTTDKILDVESAAVYFPDDTHCIINLAFNPLSGNTTYSITIDDTAIVRK